MGWFAGIYRSVYRILALEGRLPSPERIFVLDRPGEICAWVTKRVAGFAVPEKKTVWFRSEPPHPWVFTHELIHLAWKKLYAPEEEEVYSYLLPRLVLLLAERSIEPPANPFRLFEDADYELLERAVRSTLGISVVQLYGRLGLPHPLQQPSRLESVVGRKLASDKLYWKRALAIATLFDVIRAAGRNPELLRVILQLLNELASVRQK